MNTDEAHKVMSQQNKRNDLIRAGWTSKPCAKCKGTGVDLATTNLGRCYSCNGSGEKWQGPLMR